MSDDEGGLDLSSIVEVWWTQRTRIVLLALAGLVVAGAVFVAVYARRPVQQEATLTFRVLFNGVEKGQYPNGMRFTAADIVATPVLQEVYQRNDLANQVSFTDFKSAFSVIDSNPALERLRREYQDRLNVRAVTQIERSKLEDEYQSKIKATVNGTFTLVAQLGKSSFTSWPRPLTGKVLNDILSVWAEQSRAQGVFKFDLNVYSENILSDLMKGEDDYLILVDRLRVTIDRVLGNLTDLSAIPGADMVRVGEQQVSIGELEVALQDDLKFRASKIEAMVYASVPSHGRMLSVAYVNEQLFKLQLRAHAYQSRIKVIDDALASYSTSRMAAGRTEAGTMVGGGAMQSSQGGTTLIPQLGDSFLTRVMELSSENSDIAFRQDLARQSIEIGRNMVDIDTERQVYERMLTILNAAPQTGSGDSELIEMRKWVDQQFTQLIASLKDTLKKVQLLYQEVSQRSLQPSMIYTIVEPLYVDRVSTVSAKTAALLIGLAWCVYVGAIMVGLAWRGLNRPAA